MHVLFFITNFSVCIKTKFELLCVILLLWSALLKVYFHLLCQYHLSTDISLIILDNPDVDLCGMDQAPMIDTINGTLSLDLNVICQNNSAEHFLCCSFSL